MPGKKIGITLVLVFICSVGYSQVVPATFGKLPILTGGVGVLIFNGDIGNNSDLSSYSRIRAGYNLTIEQRFGKVLGVAFTGAFGKLAQSERSKTSNNNFESKIMLGDLSLVLHTDRMFENTNLTPYVAAGIGYLLFDPHGDLYDKNGVKYNYWSDGSIRDKTETAVNIPVAKTLQRDYTYETQLKDSTTNYARSTLIIPLTFGFSFKILDNFEASLGGTYFLTFSDRLDNIKAGGGNDSYFYTRVGLSYVFGHGERTADPKRYENVDFGKIDDVDSDGDGVKDNRDKCAGTDKGVKVDSDGCPFDTDKDGVPDHLDKEANSKKGAVVDANGVTLTDQMLAEKQAAWEAAAAERSESFNANPSQISIEQIEKSAQEIRSQSGSQKTLPVEFQSADIDKNGFITVSEINQVVDGFFTGDNDFTVERINRLIDFFFEQ